MAVARRGPERAFGVVVPEKANASAWMDVLLAVAPEVERSDAIWLDITSRALERWSLLSVHARAKSPVIQDEVGKSGPNPWLVQLDKAEARVMELLRGCGLSPAARRRLARSVRAPAPDVIVVAPDEVAEAAEAEVVGTGEIDGKSVLGRFVSAGR